MLLLVGICLTGCGQPDTAQRQTYQIYKHKVSLTPPKDWKVRQEKDGGEVADVVFEPPQKDGRIAVTVTDNMPQTQEVMNRFALGISMHNGKRTKEWYEHLLDDPDPQNAYFMEYEVLEPGVGKQPQKGMQVQIFTKEKVLYSLLFTADPSSYERYRSTFLAVVKSFDRVR